MKTVIASILHKGGVHKIPSTHGEEMTIVRFDVLADIDAKPTKFSLAVNQQQLLEVTGKGNLERGDVIKASGNYTPQMGTLFASNVLAPTPDEIDRAHKHETVKVFGGLFTAKKQIKNYPHNANDEPGV